MKAPQIRPEIIQDFYRFLGLSHLFESNFTEGIYSIFNKMDFLFQIDTIC